MSGILRLARELGVSIATVSRALNGKHDVNDETRARVLAAARRMGYEPNASARSLAKGATNAVGFMIELDHTIASNSDGFFMGVFDGLHGVLGRHGLDLVVLPCPGGSAQYEFLERLVARNAVDAMILSATRKIDPRIDLLQARRIPFVTVGRSTSGQNYSWVDLDFEGVVHASIDRFVAQGHRRIAVAIPQGEINFVSVFHAACRAALRRHGLRHDPSLVLETEGSERGGYDVAGPLLAMPEPPTAVLLCNEMMAIGFYRRLAELGLRPGRDVAVIALRDDPAVRFLHPSVTCFTLSLHDLGRHLGEAMLAQLPRFAEQYPLGPVQTLWPMTLRPGESDGAMDKAAQLS